MFENIGNLSGRRVIKVSGKIKPSLVKEFRLIGNERSLREFEKISLTQAINESTNRAKLGNLRNPIYFFIGLYGVALISQFHSWFKNDGGFNARDTASTVIFVCIIVGFLIFGNAKKRDDNRDKLAAIERGSYSVYDLDVVEKFSHMSDDQTDYYIMCYGFCFKVDQSKYHCVIDKIAVAVIYCNNGAFAEIL